MQRPLQQNSTIPCTRFPCPCVFVPNSVVHHYLFWPPNCFQRLSQPLNKGRGGGIRAHLLLFLVPTFLQRLGGGGGQVSFGGHPLVQKNEKSSKITHIKQMKEGGFTPPPPAYAPELSIEAEVLHLCHVHIFVSFVLF